MNASGHATLGLGPHPLSPKPRTIVLRRGSSAPPDLGGGLFAPADEEPPLALPDWDNLQAFVGETDTLLNDLAASETELTWQLAGLGRRLASKGSSAS